MYCNFDWYKNPKYHHIHPAVLALSRRHQMFFAGRNCVNDYVWNGESLAISYLSNRTLMDFSDHELLHEICHYIVAKPEQRDLPEYGLGQVIPNARYVEDVVDYEEAFYQENLAQLLCIQFGKAHGIFPFLSQAPELSLPTWDSYLEFKDRSNQNLDFCNPGLLALWEKSKRDVRLFQEFLTI